MSLASTNNKNSYVGNGTTNTYNYTFRIFKEDDLVLIIKDSSGTETTLTKTTDYTVTGVGSASGGTIFLVNNSQAWLDAEGDLDTGNSLIIKRIVDLVQDTDIRNQGDFFPEAHEDQFDYLTMIAQQQQEEIDRKMGLPETIDPSDFDPTLPTDIETANAAVVVNSSGDGLAVGPTTSEIANAETYANNASASADEAEDWANKTDGDVDGSEYSAKAYAIGGTGVSQAAGRGSAKDWATYIGGTVDDTEFSAKKYAIDAATSASDASAAAASSQWSDVRYLTFADSPFTVADTDAGTLFAVDTSGGAVVINLPSISGLNLTNPWVIGVKKTTATAADITVNRDGTDTIDGNASVTISRQNSGRNLIPDSDGTPDNWTTIEFGEVPIDGDIVGTTDTQSISNKTFTDAPTFVELSSTPATPSVGNKKLYPKDDGNFYTLDDAGNEVEVGSGAGGGSKNYFDSLSAKADTSIGSWLTDNGAGFPSGNLALSITTVSGEVLEGGGSLKLVKPAVNSGTEFIKLNSETIDLADRGRTLYGSFEFLPSTGYVADDLIVEVYDVTNSAVLFSGVTEDRELANQQGRFNYIVNTESTTEVIQLRVRLNNTNTNAFTVFFDDFKIGPAATLFGFNSSDWESISNPTLVNGPTANFVLFQKKRVGDTLHVRGRVSATSTGGAGVFGIDLTSILPGKTFPLQIHAGTCVSYQVASDAGYRTAGLQSQDNEIRMYNNDTGSLIVGSNITSGDELNFDIAVKVNEWKSSNVINQNELSIQTLTASGAGNNGASLVADTTDINFTVTDSGNGAFDGTQLTAPRSGYYSFSGTSIANAGVSHRIDAYINGTQTKTVSIAGVGDVKLISGRVYLNKGQTLSFRPSNNITLLSSTILHTINFKSDPDFNLLGVVKNKEYVASATTAAPSTVSANTWVDSNAEITLSEGSWEIGLDATLFISYISGSSLQYASAVIRDASNNLLDDTVATGAAIISSSIQNSMLPASSRTEINITEETTYKISYRCSSPNTFATVTLGRPSFTGAFTDPDAQSIIWARRV